ncbi:hypothetical protein AB1395_09605 [Streptococcus pluranimalium]|uniref:hypothetical protein n=1 Tax=Streptococcus pluranimalium TaxID=82348 RepID=UPI00346509AB
MTKEVVNGLAMFTDKKKLKDELSIKVIEKYRLVGNDVILNESNLFYGIAVMKDGEVFHRPVYPYAPNPSNKKQLERFIEKYEEELLTFYEHGHNYSFGTFLFGIGSGRKDIERDQWFEKGVVFY